ncbi:Gfo/Idh/MocA family protein [Sutcliffiella halmapala]|uniref:Gfo/Idh/MocA family protein n=1 Tax=Sutcliffiella halmapala TaxID=79882 RepID=UPI0009951934|nr:Gfo/Idh/MocA family oxidoreductase [Sutcliffiella halmapala]
MLNFAIVGAGSIAPNYAEAIRLHKETTLAAVCDNNPKVKDGFVKTNSVQKYYQNYQDLLQDSSIDVLCICTPSGMHAEMAIEAIKAGKHIIIEKPIALTLEEADRVINAAEKYGVKATVAFQKRFNPAVIQTKQKVDNGSFGKMIHANTTVRWYRDQSYYNQDQWRGTASMDGGALMNQCIHNIDLLRWMMGPVKKIVGFTTTRRHQIEMEDVGVSILEFESGALGVIEGSTAIYPIDLEASISIFGEKGTAIVGGKYVNELKEWQFRHEEEAPFKETNKTNDSQSEMIHGEGHYPIIQDMVSAIKEDKSPAISLQDGRNALEIILAIYESSTTGNIIYIN